MHTNDQLLAAARALWGPENRRLSKKNDIRFGRNGSKHLKLPDGGWFDHEAGEGGDAIELMRRAGHLEERRPNGHGNGKASQEIVYDYADEQGNLLFQVVRRPDRQFIQRRPDFGGGWAYNLQGVKRVPYRLQQLIASTDEVYITEGEKDADNMARLGFTATTNPGGAGKWRPEYNVYFKGRNCIILADNDEPGRKHAAEVLRALSAIAASVIVLELPDLKPKGDVSDWLAAGNNGDDLRSLVAQARGLTADDFWAFLPMHQYIFAPTRDLWPAASVNAQLGKIDDVKASHWLDVNRPIVQMTWVPGHPTLIKGKVFDNGGWMRRGGVTTFNLYRAPKLPPGDPKNARPWLDHVQRIYPSDAEHIVKCFAQRVQHPEIKLNHAIVLGGARGIGKDTLLAPLRYAVGPSNYHTISPSQALGRFTGFLKSVVLQISEARDLGEVNRYQFYDHTKDIISAPPDTLRIDEKNIREYAIPNLCFVIITTNHKTDGIFLPADDRGHYVAWSNEVKENFQPQYWLDLWAYYDRGGLADIAAYLANVNLNTFNPKAPPPKTNAFFDIVATSMNPDDAPLADILDKLGNPTIVTLAMIRANATGDLLSLLNDRGARKTIMYRFEACGYEPVRNPDSTQGLWVAHGQRQILYSKKELTRAQQLAAAHIFIRAPVH